MKKLGLIALNLTLLLELSATAGDTVTTTTFEDVPTTVGTDKYGNSFYEREATITTKNFKVDNFWSKFSEHAEDQSVYTNISRKGSFKVTTETTSACTLDPKLDAQGCSGQKPLLLNNDALLTPMGGTTDEFEVAFTEAGSFVQSDANTFYPLDVLRDAQYYQDPAIADPTTTDRGFFGFFTGAFDFIFSKTIGFGSDFFGEPDIADVGFDPRSNAAEDRRQRYIANIIAGIEQEQRMTKSVDGSAATQIDALTRLNSPVSLLHYAEAQKATTNDQCKFMFMNLSNDGLMCRMMGGFGMDAWMPFFNKTHTTNMQSSFIMIDTENSLLAMTGKIESVPYMNNIGGSDDDKLSFLQNILKPMTTMFTMMKNMMFGSSKASKVSNPVERVYDFDEDEAMTMTFAITNDGSQVDDFANFKLLRVRSVYGDNLNYCRVKKTQKVFGVPITLWKERFYEDVPNTIEEKTSAEWIDWCQESFGGKGMFDYLFDFSKGGFMNPLQWGKGMLNALFGKSYDILEITNNVARGLILDIKKVDTDPTSERNTRTIEVMQMHNN